MSKTLKNLIIIFISIISIFTMAQFALALDTGTGYAVNLGLGEADPRDIAINIIKIVMTFLGIIAVCVIMYAGWLWMTAGGDAAKIDKAKKALIGAIIGLMIILSSWAIVAFIVNRMGDVVTTGPTCLPECVIPTPKCCPGNFCCDAADSCCGAACCPAGLCCCSGVCQVCPCSPPAAFVVTAIQPPEAFCPIAGNTTIRNSVVRIYFNKNVDLASVDANSIVIQSSNTQCPAGALVPIPGDFTIIGKVVEFRPAIGTCPVNPCGADRCFDADSTIDIEVMTSGVNRVTTGGGAEQAQDNLIVNEHPQFFTNDLIDCQDPTVSLNSDPQVCLGIANDLGSVSSDDSGVSQIEFSDSNGNAAFGGAPVVIPCPGPGPCGQLPPGPVWTLPLSTATWLPTAPVYSAGTSYTITAIADDLDDNTASDSQAFILRPDHCCNNIIDGDEEGVDCGGSCAACSGAACGISFSETCAGDPDPNCDDDRCASGFCSCVSHATDAECTAVGYNTGITDCCLCQDKPIIDWVEPIGGFCDDDINMPCQVDANCATTCNTDTPNGAVGNFATIGGRNFGAVQGIVTFCGAGTCSDGDEQTADWPNTVNVACSDTWTDSQIIIVVPAGAIEGPIEVEEATTGNNYSDQTGDAYGNFINDFVINTIVRPGLCLVNPNNGILNDPFNLQGINFAGGVQEVLFGSAASNVSANNITGWTNLSVDAQVSNISDGLTSVFVKVDNIGSNFLDFTKNPEPYSGPYITSFEPTAGSEGQYVTIYGSGFGNSQGASKVYFDLDTIPASGNDLEANYTFPDICADSLWNDNQIIVKTPGLTAISDPDNYFLVIDLQDWPSPIDTSGLSPNRFSYDSSLPLSPSLCKIQPTMGPNNSPISLWGEYFGPEATGLVRFLLNHDQSGAAITFWGPDGDADKVETTVHQDAVSGPVRVVQAGLEGNGLNFTVGLCTEAPDPDAACGTDICCPVGSTEEGRCQAVIDDCYITVTSSVYEWDFSTVGPTAVGDLCYESAVATPFCTPTAPACTAPQFCDPATCSCQLPYVESCMGYGAEECADNLCPNSPGNCSTYGGGGTVIIGNCDDVECVSRFGAGYAYNINLNKCDNGIVCDLSRTVLDGLGNPIIAYCAEYGGAGRWLIDTSASCPVGWFNIGGNQCIEDGTTCDYCDSGLSCLDDSGSGICAIDQDICPADSTCNVGQCEAIDSATCECCCRIGFAAQDCCAPLDCTSECGTDRTVDIDEFGYCTGCALAGTTQAEHDSACNCFGYSGKYCDSSDVDYPEGICRDCAQLSTFGECLLHPASCCADSPSGLCMGGDIIPAPDPNEGYCDYYDCQIPPNEDQCDALNPIVNGLYEDVSSCTAGCSAEPPVLPGLSCYDSDTDFCEKTCLAGTACLGDTGCLDNNPVPPPPACPQFDNSCLCCCDPNNDECSLINPDLTCTPDSDPCTTADRGLCCGCSQDSDCGNPNNVSCGFDGCCRSRPQVISTTPPDEPAAGSDNVCRNSVITATFDQEMDISSFTGKVIVVGDYGISACPGGTEFLVKDNIENKNIFTRIYHKIAKAVKKLLKPISYLAKAYAPVLPANNYCAITGNVSGYNNAAGEGVLVFRPSQLLDANQRYYAIIKGDSNIADNISEGILNNWDISMNGPHTETFNARTYANSYIWSFETGAEICELSYITIDPPSYLFQTVYDTQTFLAEPKNINGQTITAITGVYDWSWGWSSDNTSVANAVMQAAPNENQGDVTSQNVEDGKTYIKAIAAITEDTVMDPSTVGQTKEGKASVYVFLCENPWPPVPASGIWEPWIDSVTNCTIPAAGCFDTSYELYYCRDSGSIGTADDFPAILSGVGDSIIRGSSTVQNVLKEIYYLREETPTATTLLTVVDLLDGSSVQAGWAAVIDPSVIGYKLYWGTSSGNYSDVATTSALNYFVNDLITDTIYYFNLTAYYDTGAESDYYGEVEVTLTDSTAPFAPTGLTATSSDSQVEIAWVDSISPDVEGYKVYYGTSAGVYGAFEDIGDVSGAIISGLTNGVRYWFAIAAYDGSGNETSATIDRMPFAAPISLTATASSTDNTIIDLSWNLDSAGVSDVNIYWGTISGGPYANSDSLGGFGALYQAIGLTPDTDYYFIVKSENIDSEESEETNEAHAKTFP